MIDAMSMQHAVHLFMCSHAEHHKTMKGRYTMNLLNLLMGTLASDSSINSLSKKTGINASLITKLLPLAIPILLKELTKNAGREGGAASLLTALGQHTNTRSIPQQIDDVDEEDGQKIVAHILGDDSDKVVSALAQETGMEGSQVSRSLGALAPALMSMLSSSANTVHSSGVNLSDGFDLTDVMGLFGGAKPQQQNYSMLGSLLGGAPQQQQSSGGLLGALLGGGAPQQQQPSGGLLGALLGGGAPQQQQPSGGLLGSLLGGGAPQQQQSSGGLLGALLGGGAPQQQQSSPMGGLLGSMFSGQSAQSNDGTELLSMLVNLMK